jgi:hypothetical protein
MTRSNNILQELKEIGTTLVNSEIPAVYTVPKGYFEAFPQLILMRVKALNANTPSEELGYLSPGLSQFSKQMPYSVPEGYFEGLEDRLRRVVFNQGNQDQEFESAQAEIKSLSPFLSGLNRQMPFSVPQGYFEHLSSTMEEKAGGVETGAKVVSIHRGKFVSIRNRKWFRFAAAAMITGIIALAGFLYFNNQSKTDPVRSLAKLEKKVDKEIKNTSDQDLSDFVQQFSIAGLNGEEKVYNDPKTEPKEFLKDVPESELKQFLQDTADPDTDDDASIMN